MLSKPEIVFFDMDHTLIDNDCDVSWKQFLIEEGLADPSEMDDVDRFFQLYLQKRLPVDEFLRFQLRQFVGHTAREMQALARQHFERWVLPKIYSQARREVDEARSQNIPTAILTATNRILAEPLAEELGVNYLVATELELREDRFTGEILVPYCYDNHKVTKATACCEAAGVKLEKARYFGDSAADIPMLERVGEPVAVNPGEKLEALARERNWRIERWTI